VVRFLHNPRPVHRRWSIRTLLLVGMGGLLVGAVAVSVVITEQVLAVSDTRRDLLGRYARANAYAREHLIGLIDAQVGVRGYLASGDRRFLESYERGKQEESASRRELEGELDGSDRAALSGSLEELQQATSDWRMGYAEYQLRERDRGPLPDLPVALIQGQTMFDRVRAAHADLTEKLGAVAEVARIRADRRLQEARFIGHGATALLFVLGALLIRALLRHTARPLIELERKATAQEPFTAPPPTVRMREIAGLQQALHNLDKTARERERARAQATARAGGFNAFGEYVQQLVDEHELHQALSRSLDDTASPDKLQVMVRNASKNRLEVMWPHALPPDEAAQHPILAEPMRCRAVRTLRTVTIDADAALACACPLGVPAEGSYCCVPMIAATELVGIVNMQSGEKGHFTREAQEASQGYINFASTTLSTIRLIASTRERALRDSLTGAYNRAFLSEYLSKQIAVAARRKRPLAVLVCDLDHFKQVNDNHGHQVGDRALVAFAALLHHAVRVGDAVIRYGGEEFVVILVDTDLAGAQIVAERIRGGAESIVVDNGTETVGAIVRTSIGVAAYPQHGADETALIGAADRAVYRAKREGRNRVIVATDVLASVQAEDAPVLRIADR
jgi:diguanylate cyclase (GGDEF)-like protein